MILIRTEVCRLDSCWRILTLSARLGSLELQTRKICRLFLSCPVFMCFEQKLWQARKGRWPTVSKMNVSYFEGNEILQPLKKNQVNIGYLTMLSHSFSIRLFCFIRTSASDWKILFFASSFCCLLIASKKHFLMKNIYNRVHVADVAAHESFFSTQRLIFRCNSLGNSARFNFSHLQMLKR